MISFEQPEPFSGLGGFVAQYNADAQRALQLHQMGLSLYERLGAQRGHLAAGGGGGGAVYGPGEGPSTAEAGPNLPMMMPPQQQRVDPLTQGEQLRMARLQQGVSAVDEQVSNGTLTAEEGAGLKTQLKTGLNPLEMRHKAAQQQAQTEMVQQHADLFKHQSAAMATIERQNAQFMAGGIKDRIQPYTDDDGHTHYLTIDKAGKITPVFEKGAKGQEKEFDWNKWQGQVLQVKKHAEASGAKAEDLAADLGISLNREQQQALNESRRPPKPRPFNPQTLEGATEPVKEAWKGIQEYEQSIQNPVNPKLGKENQAFYLNEARTAKALLAGYGTPEAMKATSPAAAERFERAMASLKNYKKNWGPPKERERVVYENRWGTQLWEDALKGFEGGGANMAK